MAYCFPMPTDPKISRRRLKILSLLTPQALWMNFIRRPHFKIHHFDNFRAESVYPQKKHKGMVIYLHGGAFYSGSSAIYRSQLYQFANESACLVVAVDYSLSPENTFPIALEECRAAFLHFQKYFPEEKILIAGDSAGGGLALSLSILLRDAKAKMPDGLILLSPWTDLTMSGASMKKNRNLDVILSVEKLLDWSALYLKNADPKQILASPVFADLSGLPPIHIVVSDQEVLLDDALRILDNAKKAKIKTSLYLARGTQHLSIAVLFWLKETKNSWVSIRQFVRSILD